MGKVFRNTEAFSSSGAKNHGQHVQTFANYRMRSRVRELRKHGSERGQGQRMYGRNIVAPPGNQAENGENKPRPATSEETGLLDVQDEV